MAFDIVIRGGTVFDGLGGGGVQADVCIAGDRIEAVVPSYQGEAGRVIDAAGLAVAPGFLDIHAHGDLYPLAAPEAAARLRDGVTTEIVGNCGESPFPQTPEMLAERADSEARFGIAVEWTTLEEFAHRHDAVGSGINRGSLVGHGNVRRAVMREADRPPTGAELKAMGREVEQALEAGAFGLSTGLIYAPGMYAQPSEIEALCERVVRFDGVYASHIRGEGESVERSVEELVHAGRCTGVRLQLSHVKVAGKANWGKADQVIEQIEAAQAHGVDLACDRYPYIASSTSLSAFLPGWAREGGRERMLARLQDAATRRRLAAELEAHDMGSAWPDLVIAGAACEAWRHAEGRSVHALAEETGLPPAEVAFELLRASGGRASIVFFCMSEENLEKWLRRPYVAIGSDSTSRNADGATAEGKPHPRGYGTSARFLGRYVRDQGILSLAEGIRRLTGLPASRLGLRRRGVLRPGAYADVTVFDAARIADRATYEHPQQYSTGIEYVLVNGAIALERGELTGVRNGRFLRRGSE